MDTRVFKNLVIHELEYPRIRNSRENFYGVKCNKICRPIFRAIIISNLAQRILKNWNIRNSDDYVKTNLQKSCTDAHFLAKIYTLESWNAIIEYA